MIIELKTNLSSKTIQEILDLQLRNIYRSFETGNVNPNSLSRHLANLDNAYGKRSVNAALKKIPALYKLALAV